MAEPVVDCDAAPTKAQLKSRPWFCRSQQTVSDDAPKCLGDGHTINNTRVGLCRGRWQWYQLSTVQDHTVPYYVIERPPGGGPAQHVRKTRVETQRHAVAFELQTSHCPHNRNDPLSMCEALGGNIRDYYTTVDVLVIDGDPRHEWDTDEPWGTDTMANWYQGDYVDQQFRYFKARKRLVMSLGYKVNRTRGGLDNVPCVPKLKDKVNIGVYCSWNPSDKLLKSRPCMYSLKAHLIPERVYDGYEATIPIAPAGEQGNDNAVAQADLRDDIVKNGDYQQDAATMNFRIDVADFDVLRVDVTRSGNNLTSTDADGNVISNGHGMLGHLVRAHGGDCPVFDSAGGSNTDQNVSITSTTTTVSAGAFCTTEATQGTYRFAVQAANEFGPFPGERDSFKQGMVGIDLQPIPMPDNRAQFKQQPGYGAFHIKVHHVAYFAGVLTSGETRPSCLSYGQWRYFTIATSGPTDASLLVELSAPVSAVLLRTDQPPSATIHATSLGLVERVNADVAAPPGMLRVSGTPCDVVRPAVWHLAVRMLDEAAAEQQGVEPLVFHFNVLLESAAAQLELPITPPTHNTSGRGYVCCGATRNFRVAGVPQEAALNIKVRLRGGTARLALVKWASCARPALDVDSATGLCRGFCELGWLATRGEYSGTLYNRSETEVQIPVGVGTDLDKRREGAWYLTVQALPGVAAYFELEASLFTPEVVALDACDRFTKVCSSDSERIAWQSGEPAAPAPPPELEGQPWITDQMIYRRIVPTICLVCGLFLGMVYYQHLKRRRLHQRIAQRV